MPRFYITTAIAYTNAPPHIGHALEYVQADAIARYRRMMGDEVRFLTGTDEHGTKIMRSAKAAGLEPQEFVDRISGIFANLLEQYGVSNDDFIRTSDRIRHWPAAEKIWRKLAENGDVYKKSYEGYYCVGHEAFIKPSELVDGVCPDHRSKPELLREENWFFRLTKYKDQIGALIESDHLRIVPARRKKEVLNLLADAEDVSFSRPSEELSWGIPVPDDPSQTMYVWADALTNYISALGYGTDERYMGFWPAQVHLVGKDIVRFHALTWPAMLLAVGLATPENLYIHGFITVDGQKMSKTVGNIVDPFDVLKKWPSEVVRYFMLRELPSDDDGDFSWKNMESRYAGDLANGLGNLVQRLATLVETKLAGKVSYKADLALSEPSFAQAVDDSDYHRAFEAFRLHDAVASVWAKISLANAYINDKQPWKQEGDEQYKTLIVAVAMIGHIAWLLQPFMPATAEKVIQRFGMPLVAQLADGQEISTSAGEVLFPRKEA